MPHSGSKIIVTIASSSQQSNTNPSAPTVSESPSCSYSEATKQSTPKKSSFKLFNKKPQTQETEEHPYSVITTAKSRDRPRPTRNSPPPPLYPTIGNPISPIKVKRKYTKRKHNDKNKYLHKLYCNTLVFFKIPHSPHPHLYQLLQEHHNLNYLIIQTLHISPLNQEILQTSIKLVAQNCYSQFTLSQIFTIPHMV